MPDPGQPKRRRQRADGEISRGRILDAATEIAAERGYDGTSIGAVSARCGLPASSIYWHFKDKDDLLAAVIERSFGSWLTAWRMPPGGDAPTRAVAVGRQIARALQDCPEFLRLGLMLALERRPVEPRARAMFMAVRDQALAQVRTVIADLAPELADGGVELLATYALAGGDGLFMAKEIGGDAVDLMALFELHARAIVDAADRLLESNGNVAR
jgi:AcrR family transcriptional regulator